jgi:hypothetical protein
MTNEDGTKDSTLNAQEIDWDPCDDRKGNPRIPGRPVRDDLPEDQVEAWDQFSERLRGIQVSKFDNKYRHRIAAGYFGLMETPALSQVLLRGGRLTMAHQGKAGSFTAYDHEMIDLVLSFDAGHWGLVANHVAFAIASGISPETVEALRDGRESELADDDQKLVAFIRGVRDGHVSDENYDYMISRLGSRRGVAQLAFFVLNLLTHVRLIQFFNEPQITAEELEDVLTQLREGTWPLPPIENYG